MHSIIITFFTVLLKLPAVLLRPHPAAHRGKSATAQPASTPGIEQSHAVGFSGALDRRTGMVRIAKYARCL